jgi:hypothetical protein
MPLTDTDLWTFMHESGQLNAQTHDSFEELHHVQKRQVVRETARQEVERLAWSSGVPLRFGALDVLGCDELVEFARSLRRPEPASPLEQMREAGVPVRDDAPEVPPHEVVAALDDIVPDGHPDRETVDRLRSQGVALSAADKDEAARIALRHGLTQPLPKPEPEPGPLNDGHEDDIVTEAQSVRRLHEAGIPTTIGTPEPEPCELTAEASLLVHGIPTKDPGSAEPAFGRMR